MRRAAEQHGVVARGHVARGRDLRRRAPPPDGGRKSGAVPTRRSSELRGPRSRGGPTSSRRCSGPATAHSLRIAQPPRCGSSTVGNPVLWRSPFPDLGHLGARRAFASIAREASSPRDCAEVDGIPVADIALTIIHLASFLRPAALASGLDSALVQGLTRADLVLDRLDTLGRKGRRGAPLLVALLALRMDGQRAPTNRFEARLETLLDARRPSHADAPVRDPPRTPARAARPRLPRPANRDRSRQLPLARWSIGVGTRPRPAHRARRGGVVGAPLLVA